jgi:hypothetical protein
MISVIWRESGTLNRRLKEIATSVDPRSGRMDRLRTEMKKLAIEDNTEKILGQGGALAGKDRFGRQLAPLGSWAHGAAFRRRGNGPVLAPHGLLSRVITRFKVVWQWDGKQYHMVCGWEGILWMIYHLTGGTHLPKRDIGGIGPTGMNKFRAAYNRFVKNLAKSGSS